MIVKNEEKILRRCLEALQPILKNDDSELIIVDTGSTDSTVEIAKEFTDKVLFYEWTKDFSAARNECIKHASNDYRLRRQRARLRKRLPRRNRRPIRKPRRPRNARSVN